MKVLYSGKWKRTWIVIISERLIIEDRIRFLPKRNKFNTKNIDRKENFSNLRVRNHNEIFVYKNENQVIPFSRTDQ